MTDRRHDDPKVEVPEMALVDPHGHAIRPVKARRVRNPKNPLHDYVTREETIKNVAAAAHAVGEKMYEQASQELAENFEALELRLVQRIANEFERRSLHGRLRALWYRFFPAPTPAIVPSVDAVEVMDPAMQHAAALETTRELLRHATPGQTLELPEGVTLEEAQAIQRELSTPEPPHAS